MADVELKCEKCGHLIKVSQFARAASLSCPHCGSPVGSGKKQEKPTREAGKPRLAVVKKGPSPDRLTEKIPGAEAESDDASTFAKTMKSVPKTNRKEKRATRHLYSWMLFLVLVPVAFLCRYYGLVPDMEAFGLAYGGYILLFWHIIIILMAFKDDTFQGILCLLVPGYSLYYLYLVSDAFYVRAVLAAVLVAFGQDGAIQIGEFLQGIYLSVRDWIGSGGGEIRR